MVLPAAAVQVDCYNRHGNTGQVCCVNIASAAAAQAGAQRLACRCTAPLLPMHMYFEEKKCCSCVTSAAAANAGAQQLFCRCTAAMLAQASPLSGSCCTVRVNACGSSYKSVSGFLKTNFLIEELVAATVGPAYPLSCCLSALFLPMWRSHRSGQACSPRPLAMQLKSKPDSIRCVECDWYID